MNELWGIAKVTGTCKYCGKVNTRETKVNRGWIDRDKSFTEPIGFGYMGDCPSCGAIMGGIVEWPVLIAIDEVAL